VLAERRWYTPPSLMIQNVPGVASAALGRILSETRVARGLTLDEVERDTRIAKRYLEALEREEFGSLPAPVYCRAFLRTYAQYLGLDGNEILRLCPEKGREPDMAPLPQVSRAAPPALSLNWIVAGGVVLVLLLAGVLLYRSGSGGGGGVPAKEAASPVTAAQGAGAEVPNPGAVNLTPSESEATPMEPVDMPDLRGSTLSEALVRIKDAGLNCVIMQVYSKNVPADIVINQSPSPGSTAGADDVITLTVSRGES
jgi:transcriptional regulator with XRE-family HTH domain